MSRSVELGSAHKGTSTRTPAALPHSTALRSRQRQRNHILRIGVVVLLVLVAGSRAMAERQSALHDMIGAFARPGLSCGQCQSPEAAPLLPVDPMSGAHTGAQNPIHANMMTKATPQRHPTTIAD